MKFTLQAGSEIETLTEGELRAVLDEALQELRAKNRTEIARPVAGGVTDGTGFVSIPVDTVPPGYELELNRVVVDADGFTPGAPFKNGSGWIDILRNNDRVDFVNLANGIPAQSIDGKDTANRFRNGEQVIVAVNGGPPNTNIKVRLTGKLRPLADDQGSGRLRHAPGH